MAEEKQEKKGSSWGASDSAGKLIALLIGAVLVSNMIASVTSNLAEDLENWSFDSLKDPHPITGETDIGEEVVLVQDAQIWSQAGGIMLLGGHAEDTKGVLVDGPERREGVWWWQVDFPVYPDGWVEENDLMVQAPLPFLSTITTYLLVISALLSLLFLTGIIYATIRLNQIRSIEEKELKEALTVGRHGSFHHPNERWSRVEEHLASDDEGSWRLAILEADILLDEMVTSMGYVGESLGEKLKSIESSDFTSLDEAWEAHKIRNQIAHEGSAFTLTHREAKRVIGLYEKVFKEFRFI